MMRLRSLCALFALPLALSLYGCVTSPDEDDHAGHSHGEEADEVALDETGHEGHEHAAGSDTGPAEGAEGSGGKALNVEEARELLKTADPQTRTQIASQLSLSLVGGSREEVKAMLVDAALNDESAEVRAAAVAGLLPLGDEAFDVFVAASRDDDNNVRAQAVPGLARTVEHVEAARSRLEALRADPDMDVRDEAAHAAVNLAGIGSHIADLGDPELDKSARAAYTLALDPDAIEPLMRTIRTSKNPRQRQAAVSVLWTICSGQTRGQKDYAEWARSFYWHGAPARDQANPVAVPLLTEVLTTDPDPATREAAAQGLGHCGDSRAVPALIKALEDPYAPVRRRAASALVVLPDNRAVEALTKVAMSDESAAVRRYATEALGWIGEKEASAALIDKLQDEESDVRQIAADHLGRDRNRTPEAIEPLLALFDDPYGDVRWEAVKAVGAYNDHSPRTKARLVACLTDPEPHVQNAAEHALRQLGYTREAPGLRGGEPIRDAGEALQRPG